MVKRAKDNKKEISEEMIIKDEFGATIATYDSELIQTIKDTVAKGATDSELYMFLQIASMYNLNPFMKEIWFTKMGNDSSIMTSRDGYAKIAKQDKNFKKCQSMAVYENDTFEMQIEMGNLVGLKHTVSNPADRGKIVGAYAVLSTYLDGTDIYSYVDFKEYDKRNSVWKKYPSAMIRKVAENDVYKRFAQINGISTVEDMPPKFMEEAIQEDIIEVKTLQKEE